MSKKISVWADPVMGSSFKRFSHARQWTPAINLYEDDRCYYVIVEIPGMDVERIDLHTQGDVLHISGTRPLPSGPTCTGRLRAHMMEIDHGCFHREVALPPSADVTGITASYRCGFLSVQIPKTS